MASAWLITRLVDLSEREHGGHRMFDENVGGRRGGRLVHKKTSVDDQPGSARALTSIEGWSRQAFLQTRPTVLSKL